MDVLELFLADPEREWFGREVIRHTNLAGGSLYPILHRLEKRGFLKSSWEELDVAVDEGRRPRRLYHVNRDKAEDAQELVDARVQLERRKPAIRSREPRTV